MYDVTLLKNNENNTQVAKALSSVYKLDKIATLNEVEQAFSTSVVLQESGELAKSYLLWLVKENNLIKGKGYKNIEAYARERFKIGKSACYNYIKVGKYINPKTALDNLPQPIFTMYKDINGQQVEWQAKRPCFTYSELLVLVENFEEENAEQFSEQLRINYHLNTKDFKKLVKWARTQIELDEMFTIPELDEMFIDIVLNGDKNGDKNGEENGEENGENIDEEVNEDVSRYIKQSALYNEIIELVFKTIEEDTQVLTNGTTAIDIVKRAFNL